NTCSFFQQHSSWRAFRFKRKATVTVYSNNYWCWQARLNTLSFCVKRLTKLHNIHTVLTQCWTNWWRRVRLTCFNLQLDISLNLFSHDSLQMGIAPEGFPLIYFAIL